MDGWLLLTAVLLLLVGEVMVFNTTYFYAFERFGQSFRFVWKHQIAVVLGTIGLIIAASLPSATYRRVAYPALLLALFALLVVFIPGVTRVSVRRWIALGPVNFQSSELAKGAIALYLAHSLSRKSERIASFLHGLLPHLVVVGFAVDLSS
jgi:cell division protein FtsW